MKYLVIIGFLILGSVGLVAAESSEDSQLSIKFKRFSDSFIDLTAEIGKELKSKGSEVKDKANSEWKPKLQEEIKELRKKLDDLVKQMEEQSDENQKNLSKK